jgi:hypothetical protein
LGSDYKSAEQIRKHWEKVGAIHLCLPILQGALNDPHWVTVMGYRSKWNHRELPLIEGEVRNRRQVVWKDQAEPPPPCYLMAHFHNDKGKVAYVGAGIGQHEYRMPDLLEAATAGLRTAVAASEAFLALVQNHFVAEMAGMGMTDTPDD